MVGYKNTTIVDCAHIDGLPYLRLVELECGHAPDQGFFLGDCDHAQLLNLSIHHCGLICAGMSKPDFCHGIYSCQGDDVLISGCHVHHNAGEGIQIWSGDKGERMTRNVTVEYSVIHDNGNCVIPSTGEPCRGTGIGLFSGEGHSARHNIVFNNNPGISVNYNATNAVVEGNSVYNNSIGILVADIDKRLAAAVVRANQIWGRAGASDDAPASTGIWLDKTSATVERNTLYGATIRDDSNGTSTLRDNMIVPSARGLKTDDGNASATLRHFGWWGAKVQWSTDHTNLFICGTASASSSARARSTRTAGRRATCAPRCSRSRAPSRSWPA